MFLDNPLGPMWRLADQARFSRWCTPFLPQFVLEGSAPRTTGGLDLSGLFSYDRKYWLYLYRMKSFGILWPHWAVPLVLAAIAAAAIVARPAAVAVRWTRLVPLLVPLAVSVAISSSAHLDSVYRNYGFVCFLLPAALCVLWQAALAWLAPARARGALAAGFVVVAALVSVSLAVQRCGKYRPPNASSRWPEFAKFAAGMLSPKQALHRGEGLGGIEELAKNSVGPQENIYSFNHPAFSGSYIFPGPDLLTEPSRTNFGGKWDVVAFGDAESATAVLKGQHIDYFLIDFSKLFFGLVPFSPLFDPERLSERFDIVWYRDVPEWDGQKLPREIASEFGSPYVCLLTWRGQGSQPLPPFIADSLRNRVRVNRRRHFPLADDRWGQLYSNMSIVYDFNKGKGYPLQRPANLRRVRGYN
jgi:hypothetical protein